MRNIDEEIAKALSAEDLALSKKFEDIGLYGHFKSLFRGKDAWVSVLSIIFGTILNGLFIYAGWKFFTVADINSKLLWGGGAWFLMTMVAFMKVWFWIRMESNRVIREVKRLELQVARLKITP